MKKVVLSVMVCAIAFSTETYAEESHPFDGVYLGLGVGGNFFKIRDEVTGNGRDGNYDASRFMGSVVIGGGKVINKIYGGIEALFDIMKNKKIEITGIKGDVQMKGFIPQVNVKAGYSVYDNFIIYGKLGCAWSKASRTENGQIANRSRSSLVFGVGAEKSFCKRFSLALDADYNQGFKSNDTTYNKGINVRALIKYNINI
jgi:opacity protein-like surface antigen